MPPPDNGPFTTFGTDGPGSSVFNSILSSLSNQFDATRTNGVVTTSPNAPSPTSSAVSVSSTANAASSTLSTSSSRRDTTLSTVPSSTASVSISDTLTGPVATTTLQGGVSSSSVASGAASTTTGGALAESQTCNSISCSSGLKAAVAVPVVVGVLGIIALVACLVRRRKRRNTKEEQGTGRPQTNKKWTRHLHVFSFDTELLMGGRFSSSNSLRSGRSSARGVQNTGQSSLHSIDEVAPPYRDAIGHAHRPNMTQTGPGVFAGGALADPIPRPTSTSTAPPPYRSVGRQNSNPTTPASHRSNPFNDPPDADTESLASRHLTRTQSAARSAAGDDASTIGGSEAASIHEAQVGRHVSSVK